MKLLKMLVIIIIICSPLLLVYVNFTSDPASDNKYKKEQTLAGNNNSRNLKSIPEQISEKEKVIINKIITLRAKQDGLLKKELKDYMDKSMKLRDEKRALYDNLSEAAKAEMIREKNLKRSLSYKAKKILSEALGESL
jgi:regulatory protein YycI of two-component signal transduction system YycFG